MFELNEEVSKETLQEFASIVSANCKPFLKAINYDLSLWHLFRGLGVESNEYVHKNVRLDDRMPTDTPFLIHDDLNGYFKGKFGEPFRNALFVSGAPHVSMSFGSLYTIFPEGDFTFVWSPKVFDLWVENKDGLRQYSDYEDRKPFIEYMDSFEYTNQNFKGAIESGKEIMVRCKSYYAFRVRPMVAETEILKALEEEIRLNM